MRFSWRIWAGLCPAAPVAALLFLHVVTGFGLRDAQALGRFVSRHRGAQASVWQAPGAEADLADFIVLADKPLLAVRSGGLCALEGGAFRPLGPPQGLLRLFQGMGDGRIWAAGTYHRLLAWDSVGGLHHVLSVSGAVREVQSAGDRLAVGYEGDGPESGQVRVFHRRAEGAFEAEGEEIPVGMDRWSGFDLSPGGLRILANLPGGKGVGVWSTEDGRMLASWPAERLARILCWVDEERVLFDRGPELKGQDAAYANPGNRLLLARVGASGEPTAVAGNFATVLSAARWPGRTRLAFSDMEGQVRVVELGPEPRLVATFAPRHRGIPWRLQPGGKGVWVLLKGDEVRLEWFVVE